MVPVPSSCLAKPNTLWVPQILADALMKEGLGGSVVQCLVREEPIIYVVSKDEVIYKVFGLV